MRRPRRRRSVMRSWPCGRVTAMTRAAHRSHPAPPMGLAEYVTYRLGRTPGEQARSFLGRPFGARSLADFWRYWNPVWGYFLLFYCYRPLRARLPRAAAAWGTFVACGLSHDLPFAVPAYL